MMVMRVAAGARLAAGAVMPTGANATVGLSASRESRSSAPDDMATTLRWKSKCAARAGIGSMTSGAIGPRIARRRAEEEGSGRAFVCERRRRRRMVERDPRGAERSNQTLSCMTRVTTILSIQSSVAYGHVGNSAVTFPLMRMGVEVWPVITVHFSNHTGYESWRGPLLSAGRPSRCCARDRRARSTRSRSMRCSRAIRAPRRSAR